MSWLGVERRHLAVCGSTSDEAARWAREGAPHGAIVTADEQTAGRGRAGRTWSSPAGANLYLSAILRPRLAPADAPGVTLAAGIAVCDAVRAAGVSNARLKWPNDVLACDRKLAGVLTEMTTRGGAIDAVILGIGVDVNGEVPIATSLREETGVAHDVAAFAELLLAHLEPWLDRFFAGGVAAIAEDWTRRAELRRVRIPAGDGTAIGLDRDGALIVSLDTGGEARVVAGDVVEI